MRNLIKLNTTFNKVEFWAVSTIFAFSIFFFIVDGLNADTGAENMAYKVFFDDAGVPFDFYDNYFFPQLIRNITIFISLMLLNFVVIPELIRRHRIILHISLIVIIFILMGIILAITDMHLREYMYGASKEINATDEIFQHAFEDAFSVFAILAVYTVIKYLGVYLINIAGKIQEKFPFFRREGTVASVIWLIVLLIIMTAEIPWILIAGWIIAIPSAILLYDAGFFILIPSSIHKKRPFLTYAFKNALILFIVLMAWGVILRLIVGPVMRGDVAPLASIWIFNSVLQMFITIPLTWWWYKRQLKGNEQVNVLTKELKRSTANFDFLRSQINPHFLFNALNTIYGTALQEGAERTGEAVQKLGDMMRFMLQENMQEKISLTREIDYLNNYISLQKLRTDANPAVQIQTDIHEDGAAFQIAPMLLIPFVENAFKHGISFREQSLIKITLEVKDAVLYFDVYNNKHAKNETDPEKDKSGIGLENVKQRLKLLYPKKNELVIRETVQDFFAHLTIQLK